MTCRQCVLRSTCAVALLLAFLPFSPAVADGLQVEEANAAKRYIEASAHVSQEVRDILYRDWYPRMLAFPATDDGILPDNQHCVLFMGDGRRRLDVAPIRDLFQSDRSLRDVVGEIASASHLPQCDFGFNATTPQIELVRVWQPIYSGPALMTAFHGLLSAEEGDVDSAFTASHALLGMAQHFANQPQPLATEMSINMCWWAEKIICQIVFADELTQRQRRLLVEALRPLVAPSDGDLFMVKQKLSRESSDIADWLRGNPGKARNLLRSLTYNIWKDSEDNFNEYLDAIFEDEDAPRIQASDVIDAYTAVAREWGRAHAGYKIYFDLMDISEPANFLAGLYSGDAGDAYLPDRARSVSMEGRALLWALENRKPALR